MDEEKEITVPKLRSAHESLEDKVAELGARLKQIAEEPQQEALDRRLKRARELRERLARRIEEAENH